ncbi:MAG: rubrerythrin family protein, partial [Anaerolineaceae bacterium]|nr:rubrerythrin family protein [Anaerolineaceae bacterium]
MSKTIEDLKEAFAGESMANRRYLAYAEKADKDGNPQVARLFRAAAAAEAIHATNHLRTLGEIQDLADNLKVAIAGENYEHSQMYPAFIEDAQADGHQKALNVFEWAMAVEKEHEALFQAALAPLKDSDDSYDYYLCPVCGHTPPR